jgi:hypothetical protein
MTDSQLYRDTLQSGKSSSHGGGPITADSIREHADDQGQGLSNEEPRE